MATLSEIFNGNPDKGSSNTIRSVIALAIPITLGLGTAVKQSLSHPELGIIPPLVTVLVPTAIGILEMFRQLGIEDRKNDKKEQRLMKNIYTSLNRERRK